jgi:hypothetical protein
MQSKWNHRIAVGLEALSKHVEKQPEAKTAFNELVRQVRHPFDPIQSDQIELKHHENCSYQIQRY